jgi:hypothetical protein
VTPSISPLHEESVAAVSAWQRALPGFATVTGMLASGLHYFPVTLPFLLVLIGLLGLVVGMAALRGRPPPLLKSVTSVSRR